MKHFLLLTLLCLASCSSDEPTLQSYKCEQLAKDFSADQMFYKIKGARDLPVCQINYENNSFYFYSDVEIEGVMRGRRMALDKPKLKEFNKCLGDRDPKASIGVRLALREKCATKLNMLEAF